MDSGQLIGKKIPLKVSNEKIFKPYYIIPTCLAAPPTIAENELEIRLNANKNARFDEKICISNS